MSGITLLFHTKVQSRLEYPEPPHFLQKINPAPLHTLQSINPDCCCILPLSQKTHFVPPFPAQRSQGTGPPLRPRKREREMATKTLKVARKVWVSNGASKVSKSKRGWIRGRIERIAAAEVERAEEAVAAEVQERQ